MRIGFGAILLVLLRRPRWRGASRDAVLSAVLLGVSLATMNSIFYLSLTRIPLGVAVTLEFWGPLTLAVIGSRRVRDLLWVVLAAAGIYLLAGGRLVADDAVGVAAALAAGGCWALYIVLGSRVAQRWPDGSGLSLAMVVAAVIVFPLAFLSSGFAAAITDPSVVVAGFAIALLSSVIPYSFEIAALRRMKTSVFGVLMSLEPGIAALVGFLVLGQVLAEHDVLAIGLVAIASAGASISARGRYVSPGELESA